MTAARPGNEHVASGHLEYYLRHGISPVHYDLSDLSRHFQRRASLYRSLGVYPVTVRGARVLEVAAGTGQNSLYLASLQPRCYTLVEPNPAGLRDIRALYSRPQFAAWRPELFEGKFEDFRSDEPYDVVVCENWLGHRPSERALLRKLGTLVAPGGVLVVTAVTPAGFLPNVLRRLLAVRLGAWQRPFAEATQLLVAAFGSHLATIAAMTRPATDWVHDCLLNPHYFNICLTVPMILEDLGQTFAVAGANPDFAIDWRWFKALHGEARDFNGHFLHEYLVNVHNFFDYRRVLPRGDAARNRALEGAAGALIATAAEVDQAARTGTPSPDGADERLRSLLQEVRSVLGAYTDEAAAPLDEFAAAYRQPRLGPEQVAGLRAFGPLFGRETVYVSLTREN